MIKKHAEWLIPLIIMILLTPFTPELDIFIEKLFYHPSSSANHFISHPILDWIYQYALIPGQLLVSSSVIVFLLSYLMTSLKKWRPAALTLILTLAIGAGFIAHALLKDHWGRPRPKQVELFGGSQTFRPYYQPNFFHQPEPSKSFVCGHCTMGFYFFALALVARRQKQRLLCYGSFFIAIVLGTTLGVTRMMQGGHFLTDVLWAALIMWFTALTMDWLVYSAEED